VTGIDFSPDMVRETAKDIESRKLNHAEIRQMDAEQMNFADASFDWVLCGFALWMFADPVRVLQGFHRVLKGGGRVALSTWAADNPSQTWCNEVLRPFVFAPAAKDLPAKIDVRFDTPLQIETALQQAGFKHVRITVEEKEFIYADEEQYWSSLWSAGFRRQLEKITPELLELSLLSLVWHECGGDGFACLREAQTHLAGAIERLTRERNFTGVSDCFSTSPDTPCGG
jgi:SAM-dependent methyltransferase